MNQIMTAIKNGGEGKVVDVEDNDEHVQVYIV